MSSAGTPPCALCRQHNVPCVLYKAGGYICRTCAEHKVDCSLFHVSAHQCIPCLISHKRCYTRHGQTDCAWCEGKEHFNCVPVPDDKELKKQLRAPRFKTNADSAGDQGPSTAHKNKKGKETTISRSRPSTPPLRTRRRAAIEEEEGKFIRVFSSIFSDHTNWTLAVDSEPEHIYPGKLHDPRARRLKIDFNSEFATPIQVTNTCQSSHPAPTSSILADESTNPLTTMFPPPYPCSTPTPHPSPHRRR